KPLLHEVAAGSLNSSEDELNYVAQAKWNHFEFQLGRMQGLDREPAGATDPGRQIRAGCQYLGEGGRRRDRLRLTSSWTDRE
ncbi:hypothetical protein F7P00_31020, partial [Pseudomonas aeruginosa]